MKYTMSLILAISLLLAFDASAQRWATANGDPALNPNSGLEIDPTFCYDPSDGLFYIYNAGPNGIDDTPASGLIDGDDFGLNSLLIPYSGVDVILAQPPFGNGLTWSSSLFAGNIRLNVSSSGPSGSLPVSVSPIPILQLDTGLTADAFRNSSGNVVIELASVGNPGGPGQSFFSAGDAAATGAFKLVPEPTSLCLILGGGLLLVGWRRRHDRGSLLND